MRQTRLDLPQPPASASGEEASRTGFQIGWDHAHHGLVPPAELLRDATPVAQGWQAARAVFGQRTLQAPRALRWWLQWRTTAWQQGISFDDLQVTPHYLAQLHTETCPVLRQALGGAPGEALAAVVERLNPAAGFAAGNLMVMSQAASTARQGLNIADLARRARQAERRGEAIDGLDAAAWWRLAALGAFAQPTLPFFEAASLPLAVLPPNRVRVLSPALGLQALVTQLFARPGWSARARALAQCLPEHTLRHDFNLFVGAMAPRVLDAGVEPAAVRRALEDAWLHERVQRRWQHFVLSLGEVACEALLAHAAEAGLAGIRTLTLAPEQAVEGWGLPPAAPEAGAARQRSVNTGARLPRKAATPSRKSAVPPMSRWMPASSLKAPARSI